MNTEYHAYTDITNYFEITDLQYEGITCLP